MAETEQRYCSYVVDGGICAYCCLLSHFHHSPAGSPHNYSPRLILHHHPRKWHRHSTPHRTPPHCHTDTTPPHPRLTPPHPRLTPHHPRLTPHHPRLTPHHPRVRAVSLRRLRELSESWRALLGLSEIWRALHHLRELSEEEAVTSFMKLCFHSNFLTMDSPVSISIVLVSKQVQTFRESYIIFQ